MDSYWTLRVEQIVGQALANASAGYQQRTEDSECDDLYATVYAIQNGKLGVTEADFVEQAKGAIFNLYAWGQDDSISLQETTTGKWLTYTTGDDTTLEGVSLEEDAMHLGAGKTEDGEVVTSVMPGNMRREYVDDTNTSFRLLANTFTGGFFNDFEDPTTRKPSTPAPIRIRRCSPVNTR